MLQQFKSMDELTSYLGKIEERVKNLEAEYERLRANTPSREVVEIVNEEAIERLIFDYLPDSNLIHPIF